MICHRPIRSVFRGQSAMTLCWVTRSANWQHISQPVTSNYWVHINWAKHTSYESTTNHSSFHSLKQSDTNFEPILMKFDGGVLRKGHVVRFWWQSGFFCGLGIILCQKL